MDKNIAPALQFFLLGSPRLALADTSQQGLLVKAKALLFYLACNPQTHSRASLAALLWSDLPETKARTNLRTVLSRLRPDFGEYIIANRQAIKINPDTPYWLDVQVFEQGLSQASPSSMREALTLYRGDFLGNFYIQGALSFEEWVVLERERLRNLALEGLSTLASNAYDQGDFQQAAIELRRLLLLDPWRESAHRELMRLLAQTGDRAAALTQYEACRQILERELGVEPASATVALYEQIRAGTFELIQDSPKISLSPIPPQSQQIPNNLPAATTSFHGREDELKHILRTIAEPGCRMLTLTGFGGIGKTRLMLEFARTIVDSGSAVFKDGIFWVPVAAVETLDALTTSIAHALGYLFSGRKSPRDQILSYLGNKQILLLLDNLEQLIEEAPFFTDLLQAAPNVKMLVTSRERLNLYEEWVLDLEGLAYPETDTLETAGENYAAVQLFSERARRVNLSFDLEKESEGVIQICQLVKGLPLGIELAASWSRAFDPRDIAAAIQKNLYEFDVQLQNVPKRHRSLQATFEYSWELLTPEEQAALAGLAVFRGGFPRDAATLVSSATNRILSNLVEKSLIRRVAHQRYEMHEQLRLFSWQKLQVDTQHQIRIQHFSYYAEFLFARQTAIQGREQDEMVKVIQIEIDNIRTAWSHAAESNQIPALLKMVRSLFSFYLKTGLQQEGFHLFADTIIQLQKNNPDDTVEPYRLLLGKLLAYQGRCGEFTTQNFDEPQTLLKQGLEISRQNQDDHAITQALFGLGLLAIIRGDSQQSEVYLQECRDICQDKEIPWTLADALNMLAWIANQRGNAAQAIESCQQALSIKRDLNDKNGIASVLTTLGTIYSKLKEYEQAEMVYKEVLELCRQSGQQVGAAQALTGLFGASFRQGNYDKAAEYADESLSVNRDAGDRLGEAIAYHNLGFVAAFVNHHPQAIEYFDQAVDIYRAIGTDSTRLSNTYRYMIESYIAMAELENATTQLRKIFEIGPDQIPALRKLELILTSAKLLIEMEAYTPAADLLVFMRDDDGVPQLLKEQAAATLSSFPNTPTPSRFNNLDEALISIKLQLDGQFR